MSNSFGMVRCDLAAQAMNTKGNLFTELVDRFDVFNAECVGKIALRQHIIMTKAE